MSWHKAYQSYNGMTISELKEILKSKNLPVSGRKIDLIRYLIFDEYPDFDRQITTDATSSSSSMWLKLKYEMWLSTPEGFFATGRSFAAINYQDINSKVA